MTVEYKQGPENIRFTCPGGEVVTGGGQLSKSGPEDEFAAPLLCPLDCDVECVEINGKMCIAGFCKKENPGTKYFQTQLSQ